MRVCSRCLVPDERIIRRGESCTCAAQSIFAPDAEHTPDCHMVGHKVVADWPFPQVLRPRDLIKDEAATHGYRLQAKYRGWKLVEVPGHADQFARVKTLCRACIVEEMGVAARVKEYEAARRRYADAQKPPKSFSQAIAMQDFF